MLQCIQAGVLLSASSHELDLQLTGLRNREERLLGMRLEMLEHLPHDLYTHCKMQKVHVQVHRAR